MYDDRNPKLRVLRKLWRCAKEVRKALGKIHRPQSALVRNSEALNVTGVIYAIYCERTRFVYVGQTIKSAMARFEEHARSALRGEGERLHAAMRRFGWEQFRVFPLEILPSKSWASRTGKARTRAFRQIANPRERFWINFLHSYHPQGFNMVWSRRFRTGRKRVANPMRRHRVLNHPQQPMSLDDHMVRWHGSRDWLRRCKYLERRFDTGTLNDVDFGKYAKRTLSRMLKFLEYSDNVSAISPEARAAILALLRTRLLTRSRPSAKAKRNDLFIKIEWTTHLIGQVRVRELLLDPAVTNLLPYNVQLFWDSNHFMVVKRCAKPIRSRILNYQGVAKKLDRYPEPSNECHCRTHFPTRFRPDGGCVLTGDLDLVTHAGLRKVLTCGPNFRDRHVNASALNALETGLADLANRLSDNDTPLSAFDDWKNEILKRCATRLDAVQPNHGDAGHAQRLLLDASASRALRRLQRFLVIVPVDKASNNVSFVCKSLYANRLREELHSDAYQLEQRSVDKLIEAHKRFLQPKHLTSREDVFPFLYWLPKFHKDPVGERYIAASARCTTSSLSKVLSDMLLFVLRTLREKDDCCIRETGVRRFFVVETYEEVANMLSSWRRNQISNDLTGLYTGDFSTMYTSIPHDELFDAIKHTTREAFEAAAKSLDLTISSVKLHWAPSGCKWVRGAKTTHQKTAHVVSWTALNVLVRFLVVNTFLCADGKVRRQSTGIPMGTNCAPVLANLFLYYYESRFVSRIETEKGTHAARLFHNTFRLIDDVLAVDNPLLRNALSRSYDESGMYPSSVTLNQTSTDTSRVDFIGMTIETVGKRLRLSVFDKRKSFPFHVRRYPLTASLIPRSIPYGVFVGLLHRGYRICSDAKDFLSYAGEVGSILRANGCSTKRLKILFKSFVVHEMHKYRCTRTYATRKFCHKLGSDSGANH